MPSSQYLIRRISGDAVHPRSQSLFPVPPEKSLGTRHVITHSKCLFLCQYIVMESVEERMLSLQDIKRELMSATFGTQQQNEEERRRARVRDIQHLIGLRVRNAQDRH